MRLVIRVGIGDGFGCIRGCFALVKPGQIPYLCPRQGSNSEHLWTRLCPLQGQNKVIITFLQKCHPSSLLVVRHQSGSRHNLWVWFIHPNTCPSECLNSKFHTWGGTDEQHRLGSSLGTWGAGSQRFLNGTWFVPPEAPTVELHRELQRAASGDGVQQPRFPSSREMWGTLCQICTRNCSDCVKAALCRAWGLPIPTSCIHNIPG